MNTLKAVLNRFAEAAPIEEGWSKDQKYSVTNHEGKKFLLRFFGKEKTDFKRTEFEMMKKAAAQGIPMCQPVEFGLCEDGGYYLLTWIDGYFDGKVPEKFWELLMFYLAANEIAAPAWGQQFTDGTEEKMIRMAEEVYDWFDGMKNPVPGWYAERQNHRAELNK